MPSGLYLVAMLRDLTSASSFAWPVPVARCGWAGPDRGNHFHEEHRCGSCLSLAHLRSTALVPRGAQEAARRAFGPNHFGCTIDLDGPANDNTRAGKNGTVAESKFSVEASLAATSSPGKLRVEPTATNGDSETTRRLAGAVSAWR